MPRAAVPGFDLHDVGVILRKVRVRINDDLQVLDLEGERTRHHQGESYDEKPVANHPFHITLHDHIPILITILSQGLAFGEEGGMVPN